LRGDGCCRFRCEAGKIPGRRQIETVWKFDAIPETKGKEGKLINTRRGSPMKSTHSSLLENRIYVVTGQGPEHGEGSASSLA